MMKAQVFLVVAVMFLGMGHAQRCYRCLSFTSASNFSALPSFDAGFVPCDEDYKLTTVDCSGYGGCLKGSYNLVFDIEGQGRVEAVEVTRKCGPALDICETVTEEQINTIRDGINALLPSTIQFVSATGTECACTGDLCNGAPTTALSLGALLASVLVSYIAMKR